MIENHIDERKEKIEKKAEPVKPQVQPVDSLEQQGEEMLALMPKAISYQQALRLDY